MQAYELAPLRRQDIELALQANDINSDVFWREVSNADVDSFVARPITLDFLLNEFQREGARQLPTSKYSLYKSGCLKLCREAPR